MNYTRKQIDETCDTINQLRWVAHHYPRKKRISINGGKLLPIPEAMQQMLRMINEYPNPNKHNQPAILSVNH